MLGGGLAATNGGFRRESNILALGRIPAGEKLRTDKLGGGGLQSRGRVSTAAMAENLKDLRLDDGAVSGAAADKVC